MKTKCEICDVDLKDTKQLQPVFVSFPHGTLLVEEVSRLSCTVWCHKTSRKRHVAIATEEGNVYVGSKDTLDDESLSSNVCNTFIAIRNRKTNKIRLVESDSMILSRFVAKQDDVLTEDASKSDITTGDKYLNLHRSFGSKMKKRASEQIERYKTDVNTLRDNLMEVVDTVNDKKFKKDIVITNSILIPRCNRLATTVDQVYQLHDIITELELTSMEQEALKVTQNLSNLNEEAMTPFFLKNMPRVMESRSNIGLQQRLQVLLYADCVLKYFKSNKSNKKLHMEVCPFSPMIAAKLLREFTLESNKKNSPRLRPVSMRFKAMCQVIVLGLLVLGFKLDLNTIKESTLTSIKDLLTLTKEVGATVVTVGETLVELKLPLAPLRHKTFRTPLK